ncbi:MAG: threonine synthase [Clostridia bacterium]|nr:threonine synthase [Clostridia bacterium]
MKYKSTRSTNGEAVSAAVAIKNGLAPDGGLYMPESIPTLSAGDLAELAGMSYPERAARILSLYLTDYTEEELLADCRAAYAESRFPGGAAPVRPIDGDVYSLELWHGPTSAFKDMALQIMPRLLSRALKKTGEDRTALILVATSGDTGKAALEGYRDVDGVKILVFYPTDGVSRIQKLQMTTQEGKNVGVRGIYGNFDDAQSGVKRIFSDAAMAEKLNASGVFLSSANSINWGRLAPQIAYYVSAYCDMVAAGHVAEGAPIDVAVPTGNFGNIFAAYLARLMGVPIGRLICASNSNNVLTEFLETGTYDRNRTFHMTVSPSMDILISSNLERLLYLVLGAEKTADYMKKLSEIGVYSLAEEDMAEIKKIFVGYSCDEAETAENIRTAFTRYGYLIDTHTAVGYGAARKHLAAFGAKRPIVLASTASPYKFAPAVYSAVKEAEAPEGTEALLALEKLSSVKIPAPLSGLDEKPILHAETIEHTAMPEAVLAFAGAN